MPDMYILGKALGGGIVPVSAVVSSDEILGVIQPGNHGSTFGGNPLAAAVGQAVVRLLATGEYPGARQGPRRAVCGCAFEAAHRSGRRRRQDTWPVGRGRPRTRT